MKKLVVMMMVSCLPTMMMAQPAKYCMTYSDYKAHNWNTIESLVNGRSEMIPQIKMDESDIKVKSGDKEVDRILICVAKTLFLIHRTMCRPILMPATNCSSQSIISTTVLS